LLFAVRTTKKDVDDAEACLLSH